MTVRPYASSDTKWPGEDDNDDDDNDNDDDVDDNDDSCQYPQVASYSSFVEHRGKSA